MSYIQTYMRSVFKLLSCVAIAILLIVSNGAQAQEGADFGEATEKASSDTKKFFSYFTDWVMLSHIHRSGENAAQVDNLFNAFLKDYASNPILQDILDAFNTGELGLSAEGFFQQTGIRVYFVGNIDISESDPRFEPVLSLLNESLNAKIQTPSAPYIIVTNNLSGNNDAGYKITTVVRYSDEIKAGKYNLDKSDSSNPFMASLNPSASRRNEAGNQIKEAMMDGLATLSANVKENYLPNLMIAYRDKLYKSGESIEVAVTKNGTITLEALNKELLAPTRTVEWSISPDNDQASRAIEEGNKLTFPTETGGEFAILASAGSDEVNVTLKIQGLGQDLKDFLKKLLLEALKPRLEAAIQQQSTLKGDSTEASNSVVTNIENVENANFPLEGAGQELTVLQEPTVLSDTSVFSQSEVRTNAFKSLRRKKNLVKRLQKVYQLVSYINKVLAENDQEVKDLVDALVENSGELLAQFVITGLNKNDSTAMKDIVANFLDDNLGELAGTSGESAFATFLEPIEAPRGLPSGYSQGDNYYISPLVPLEDREQIIANIAAYHATQQTPTFVVINYSQDVSMESYLARASTGAPKGLASGQDYVVINYVNIPGSVEEMIVTDDPDDAEEIVNGEFSEYKDYFVDLSITIDLSQVAEEGNINYLTPGGSIITLPQNSKPTFTGQTNDDYLDANLFKGALLGFENSEGKWTARFNLSDDAYSFIGYVKNSDRSTEFDEGGGFSSGIVLIGSETEFCSLRILSGQMTNKEAYTYGGGNGIITSGPSDFELLKEIPLNSSDCELDDDQCQDLYNSIASSNDPTTPGYEYVTDSDNYFYELVKENPCLLRGIREITKPDYLEYHDGKYFISEGRLDMLSAENQENSYNQIVESFANDLNSGKYFISDAYTDGDNHISYWDDKLKVFEEVTSTRKIIVLHKVVPFYLKKNGELDEVEAFAKAVVDKSGINTNNTTIIIIPAYQTMSFEEKSKLVLASKNVILNKFHAVGQYADLFNGINKTRYDHSFPVVQDFYVKVPKPLYSTHAIVNYKGDVSVTHTKSSEDVTGYSSIYRTVYAVDQRTELYRGALCQYWAIENQDLLALSSCSESGNTTLDWFEIDYPTPSWEIKKDELLESAYKELDSEGIPVNALKYAQWLGGEAFHRDYSLDISDDYFRSGINEDSYQDIQSNLDNIGFVLGFVGADGATDAISLYLAVDHGKVEDAAIYTTSLLVTFGSAKVTKEAIKWIEDVSKGAKKIDLSNFNANVKNLEKQFSNVSISLITKPNIALTGIPITIKRFFKPSQVKKIANFKEVLDAIKRAGIDQNDALLKRLSDDMADERLLKAIDENPNLIDDWKLLSDLVESRTWVRQNPDILKKFNGLASNQKARLKKLYKNMPLPDGRPKPTSLPFPMTKNIEGFGPVTINYDKYGFPKFDDFMRNRKVVNNAGAEVVPRFPGPLKGTEGGDLKNATDWALENFPTDKVRRTPSNPGEKKKNTIDIFVDGDWVTHTWHHHQNGKDLFPVPSKIHNARDKGFAHSGGDSILGGEDNLVGVFDDPIF